MFEGPTKSFHPHSVALNNQPALILPSSSCLSCQSRKCEKYSAASHASRFLMPIVIARNTRTPLMPLMPCADCTIVYVRTCSHALIAVQGLWPLHFRGPAHLRACGHCTLGSVGIALRSLEPSYFEAHRDPISRPCSHRTLQDAHQGRGAP